MTVPFSQGFKIWKLHERAPASIKVAERWASLAGGDARNFLTVSDQGVSIGGKVSFQTTTENIKIGGLFRLNYFPLLLIPSTMVTPFPVLLPTLPIPKETMLAMLDAVKAMGSLLM